MPGQNVRRGGFVRYNTKIQSGKVCSPLEGWKGADKTGTKPWSTLVAAWQVWLPGWWSGVESPDAIGGRRGPGAWVLVPLVRRRYLGTFSGFQDSM